MQLDKPECDVTDLKVGSSPLARFILVRVIEKSALHTIKDKPSLVPRLETRAHFVQVASSGLQGHVGAQFNLMSGRLHVLAQIKTIAPDGQVTRQWPLLLLAGEMKTKLAVSLHTERKVIKSNDALLEVFVCL